MHTSPIPTYGQLHGACEAFSHKQWISMLAAFTTVVVGSPSPTKVWLNVLSQPNPMHLFTYVTASRHITTIHHISKTTTRMGEPTTQWHGMELCYGHGLGRYGGQDCGANIIPNQFNRATPIFLPINVEEVLQYFDNNPQSDYMPTLLAGQVHPGTETLFVRRSNFVPHFLAPLFVMECRSPKAMLQLGLPVLVLQC